MANGYQVKLEGFEGPLDLLLHLINRYEIDIYDIPVAQITEQYMNYIHTMQQLELNLASEYLVMAASLLAMKSQQLLPNQPVETDDEEFEEDPREDLMRRLIEYRKYKQAASELKERELTANKVHTRAPAEFEIPETNQSLKPGDISVLDMVTAMQKVMKRKNWNQPVDRTIGNEEVPITTRMTEVLDRVKETKKGILFHELFTTPSRPDMVVTFMAVLELMKENHVHCEQENHFEDLRVYYVEGAT